MQGSDSSSGPKTNRTLLASCTTGPDGVCNVAFSEEDTQVRQIPCLTAPCFTACHRVAVSRTELSCAAYRVLSHAVHLHRLPRVPPLQASWPLVAFARSPDGQVALLPSAGWLQQPSNPTAQAALVLDRKAVVEGDSLKVTGEGHVHACAGVT